MTQKRKPLRPAPSTARRPAHRQVKPSFLIVCEGETERDYFGQLKQLLRGDLVRVEVATKCGRDPMGLVEAALRLRRKAEAEARRSRDENQKYDKVWCVFDVDDHVRLQEARQHASRNGILTAISNPAFELWALLHFHEQRAHIERQDAKRVLCEHLPGYDKHKKLSYTALKPRYETAVKRAQWLDQYHERDGEPGGNPSTGVWQLTEAIWEGAR